MTDLAAKIRHMRTARGLKQTGFAQLLGTTQATVSRWESGSMPEPEYLVALAKMAEQSVAEFISGDAVPSPRVEVQPAPGYVMLPFALPTIERMTEMMASMLDTAGLPQFADDYAEPLAQLLPTALAQASVPIAGPQSGGSTPAAAAFPRLATADRGNR